MDFSADHFALFGLSRAFRIDSQMLEQRYRDLQTQVHPDRHAAGSDSDRRCNGRHGSTKRLKRCARR